jgi:hypothetical protein
MTIVSSSDFDVVGAVVGADVAQDRRDVTMLAEPRAGGEVEVLPQPDRTGVPPAPVPGNAGEAVGKPQEARDDSHFATLSHSAGRRASSEGFTSRRI